MKNYEYSSWKYWYKIIDEFEELLKYQKKLFVLLWKSKMKFLNVNTTTKNQFDKFYDEINQAQIIRLRLENRDGLS